MNAPKHSPNTSAHRDWFAGERPTYERLTETVVTTLRSLLSDTGINYLDVYGRTKELASFADKIERKQYSDPRDQMTDLSGVRVITFIESDVEAVNTVIRGAFNVYPEQSLDKVSELGKDRFGYRSVHFVCDLGEARSLLPENRGFTTRKFEIQVRTVLQHAWAEIHHDRSYKFRGTLPSELERRLYSAAAVLEMVDREFDAVAKELDRHVEEVEAQTAKGELDVEITSASLRSFMRRTADRYQRMPLFGFSDDARYNEVIDEAHQYGLRTIADWASLFTDDLIAAQEETLTFSTDVGCARTALLWADWDRYWERVKQRFAGTDHQWLELFIRKYPQEKVLGTIAKRGIEIIPERQLSQTSASLPLNDPAREYAEREVTDRWPL